MHYRKAGEADITAMAKIRSADWGAEEGWRMRITGYMRGEVHPQQALMPRMVFVATEEDVVTGFIAGHLTQRYECDGELQWINVSPGHRRNGIASGLLRMLAAWFIKQKAKRICVDVDPANSTARRFYMRHAAEILNKHWLVWNDINVVLKKQ
jgi:ribosomal protein S18 acetylase RimI-like enzyme